MATDYESVIAAMYQAAVTRHGWADALHGFAALNHSRGTNLVRGAADRLDVLHSPSLTATVAQFVEQGWDRADYRTQRTIPLLDHGFVADQHIVADEDASRSAYYDGFARPAGVPWYAATGLVLPDGAMLGLSLQRSSSEGAFSASELARLNRLLPRLREILLLAYRLGVASHHSMLSGLDLVGQAAVLFDGQGLVCGINAAAEALTDRLFSTHGRQLIASDPRQRGALAQRIAAACLPPHAADATPHTIRLEDHAGRAWIGQVAPLTGPARDFFGGGAALLILSPAFARPRSSRRTLAVAFGLTPSEAAVAELLAHGMTADAIAEQLRMSRNAVRFHIKAILPKAGVQRQAGLVAAAAALGAAQVN